MPGWRLRRRATGASALVLVLAAGAGLAAALPSASVADSSSPSVNVYAVPSADYSTPVSTPLEPMAAAPDGRGELFAVNDTGAGSAKILEEPATGGTPSLLSEPNDPVSGAVVSFSSLVSDGTNDWGIAPDGAWQFPAGDVPTQYAQSLSKGVGDMVLGPDTNLYFTEAGSTAGTRGVSQLTPGGVVTDFGSPSSQSPESITSSGGLLYFTTSTGQLWSMTTAGTFSAAALQTGLSPYPHSLAASGATLWAIGAPTGSSDGGSDVVEINASTGQVIATFAMAAGLPADPGLTAITVGLDGNVWFTESKTGDLGALNVSTGQVTNFAMPAGFVLPAIASGSDDNSIAPGPVGSSAVYFGAQTSSGAPAIGEITGSAPTGTTSTAASTTTTAAPTTTTSAVPTTTSAAPTTTPAKPVTTTATTTTAVGTLALRASTVKVTAKGVAAILVKCSGKAACTGTLKLTITEKEKVKGRTKQITVALGSARYSVKANGTGILSIKLTATARKLLTAAPRHRLKVIETAAPRGAKARTGSLTLVGAVITKK